MDESLTGNESIGVADKSRETMGSWTGGPGWAGSLGSGSVLREGSAFVSSVTIFPVLSEELVTG